MTDFYGANHTKAFQNNPSEKIGVGEQAGRLRVAYDSYDFSAVITTSDSLKMMKLPKGARVIEVRVNSDDLGTTGTLNIGWEAGANGDEAADADGFFAALDVKAAAVNTSMSKAGSRQPGLNKKFAEEVQVAIVPAEDTTATSGTIELIIEYILE